MAEWARLLSECWVKPVAGSNPALPATTKNAFRKGAFFVVSSPQHPSGGVSQSVKSKAPTGGALWVL